jgi:protein O-GlcNAc transferase
VIDPGSAEAWSLLAGLHQARAECEEALSALRRSVALEPSHGYHSDLLLGLQYADDAEPTALLAAHREWEAAHTGNLLPIPPPTFVRRSGDQPLRIGFVSSHFGQHPIGFLALPMIECLDKAKCKVFCYSDRVDADEYTRRFQGAASVWRTTTGLPSDELAGQIRADEIDILVDLMGHTGERLLAFARKPAPLQVTWLGYVGTTGMSAMDCLLADRFHVRSGEESNYVETVLRMPNDYACYGPPADVPEVGPLPALKTERVTLGCFNNPAKYGQRLLDAWAEILRRIPTAQLLLRYLGLDDTMTKESLRRQFSRRGVDAARVLLEGEATHRELLASYNRIDIALDTQPYSGGLTTCEALWMGVPVVTWPGKTFAGRHATSHLMNAGYGQFVAQDSAGYAELAVQWASQLNELAAIRSQMRERVRQSPLCDAPQFALDFLSLLHRAWKLHVLEKA